MASLRILGIIACLGLLAGCASQSPLGELQLHGPCAPNYVSLGLNF
jgi:hypothetical protein